MTKLHRNISIISVLFYPTEAQILHFKIFKRENLDINFFFIDNTPEQVNLNLLELSYSSSNIHYIPLKKNVGIAKAQNVGIRKAIAKNDSKYFLFLDQDSQIPSNFAQNMIREYERIKEQGILIAALGPTPVNKSTGKKYKQEGGDSRIQDWRIQSTLISSGMLIPKEIIDEVGPMDEFLFIDMVDFEWCWRAKSKGFVCCITEKIVMDHKVGEADRTFFGFPILVSAPARYFYQYRNYLLLLRRPYVPLNWKIKNFIRKVFILFYLPVVNSNGRLILQNIMKGIYSAMRSQLS